MKAVLAVLGAILAFILLIVAVIGFWWLGWFVKEKNVDKQVHIDRRNNGTQIALHDQALQDIKEYNVVDPSNVAAKAALLDQACRLIGQLVPDYKDDPIAVFQEVHCQ